MENEFLQRLAILETKIETLIVAVNKLSDSHSDVDKRLDELENLRHWVAGIAVSLGLMSSLLFYSANSKARDIAISELKETRFLDRVCSEYKMVYRPTATATPDICL